jgi:hypothetical protein
MLVKLLLKDKELVLEEYKSELIAEKEARLGWRIAKTEDERDKEELLKRSMETHTRKIVKLMGELKKAFVERMEEWESDEEKEQIREDFEKIIDNIQAIMNETRPVQDKSFYF